MPLPNCRFSFIWPLVNLRILLACLIAVAMSFAPFAMPMEEVRAAPSAGHHSGMMSADHCDEQQTPDQHKSQKEKSCCVAGCMTAAMLPATSEKAAVLAVSIERPGLDRFHLGVPAEIATPPPRAS